MQEALSTADCVCGGLVMNNHSAPEGSQWRVAVGWTLLAISGLLVLLSMVYHTPLSCWWMSRRPMDAGWCANNMHQLGMAIESYGADNGERFPDPDRWPELTVPYMKSFGILKCPKADYHILRKYPIKYKDWDGPLVTSYAMNERLRGLSVKDVRKPEETVLLFESNGEKLCGGPELLPKEARHEQTRYLVIHDPYVNVLFADLHVNKVPLDQVRSLKWDPK